jgi:spermidine synthase
LSEEILWVRVVGFEYHTLPPAFSFVLTCYLVGIAAGAALGKRICGRVQNLYAAAAVLLAASAIIDVLTPWLIGALEPFADSTLGVPALLIACTAILKSSLFPLVHHLGSPAAGANVGRFVSRIYFGNVVGATLGPLVTGFLALDWLSIDACFGLIAAMCLLASLVCVIKSGRYSFVIITSAAIAVSGTIAFETIRPGAGVLGTFAEGGRDSIRHFVANRHGVIHTASTPYGELVFGGNVYDGMPTANPDRNLNRLDRLYMLALVQEHTKRVLFVGLSTGAWVRAMQGFPEVESIDVVEINSGYIQLVQSYPELAPLLQDPRIHIHIDDGRRWLRRNPKARFDAIVQNASYHWRANVGNLLSRDYLLEVKEHLNAGGVLLNNTTGSFDVLATTQAVFPRAYRYANFVYASDRPLTPVLDGLWKIRRPDGRLFSRDDPVPHGVLTLLSVAQLEPVDEFLARRNAAAEIITDDNLLTEYKHGKRFGPDFLQTLLPPEAPTFDFR